MKQQTNQIIFVLILIVLALGAYVVYDWVSENIENSSANSWVAGYQNGTIDAITTIYTGTSQCQRVPITLGEQTITLLAEECLQG